MVAENDVSKRMEASVLHDLGLSVRQISKRLGRHKSWVQRWLKRYQNKENCPGSWYEDAPKEGRPKITEPVKKKIFKEHNGQQHQTLRKTAKRLTAAGTPLSHMSVARVLKEAGLKPFKPRLAPALTPSQMKNRVKFAKDHLHRDWNRTLFTDEKDFPLFHPPNKQNTRVWAPSKGDVPITPQMKHPPTLKVWGGISGAGKLKLVFYKDEYCTGKGGGMTGADYSRMLEEKVLPEARKVFGPGGNWTFLQDGASPHSARVSIEKLEAEGMEVISGGKGKVFPSDSPDLNYLENIWGWMQDQFAIKAPKTVAAAEKFIKELWDSIDDEMVKAYVVSMPKRLAEVIRLKGETIKV